MSAGKGLASLKKAVDKASDNSSDYEKANWLKMAAGDKLVFHFIQEIDADSPKYSEKNGLTVVLSEHSNPNDFRKKFVCTMADEGKCVGCELDRERPKSGWRAKSRFYANIVVDGETEVKILSQGLSGKAITPTLAMYAEELGSITDQKFRIIRNGNSLSNTTYALDHRGPDPDFQPEDYTPYDLEQVCTRNVEYADQREFIGPVDTPAATTAEDIW